MQIQKSTIRTKKNLIIVFSRYISLAVVAALSALVLPAILASTFTIPNHSVAYDQSTANLYAIMLTTVVLAFVTHRLAINQTISRTRVVMSLSLIIALVLGILTILSIRIGISNIIGVAPNIAETKLGIVLFAAIQISILGVSTVYFWRRASIGTSRSLF